MAPTAEHGSESIRTRRTTSTARINAREAYLPAFIRARCHRSVEGALQSAEAFGGLGDHAVSDQCFRVAAELAAGDEQAERSVREARQRQVARQAVGDF